MPDGYTVTPWRSRQRLGCDLCDWGTTMLSEMRKHISEVHGVRRRRRREPEAEPASAPTPDGVDFASDEAAELAAAKGNWVLEILRGMVPSGKNGYTVADVRAAAFDTTSPR